MIFAAIIQVVVGNVHTCALADDGTVSCWGYNRHDELGDGTHVDRATPAPVHGLHDAVSLEAQGEHTCARRRGGQVMCWGDKHGLAPDVVQLSGPCTRSANGRASCEDSNEHRVDLAGIADAVDIAADPNMGCVARRSGLVSCWFSPEEPSDIPGIIGAVDVAVGSAMACARDRAGAVSCWRWAFEGGGKHMRPLHQLPVTPKRVIAAGATALVNGFDRVCALSRGEVRCIDFAMKPAPLPVAGPVRSLALGGHSCAVRGDRDVVCWGNDDYGQLGNGWSDAHPTPTLVPGLRDAIAIETSYSPGTGGSQWSCAVLGDHRTRCWGNTSPTNTNEHNGIPKPMPAIPEHRANPAAGEYAKCIVRADYSVWCSQGQFVNAVVTAPTDGTPVKIEGLPAITQVALGFDHACALSDTGSVWCWGDNAYGQTGGATTKPARVAGIAHATQISAGTHHTCALLADRQVACWGEATTGQVGTFATERFETPVAVRF